MPSDVPPPIEQAKRLAAQRAVKEHLPESAHYVGVGSGSTVVYVVEAIAALPAAVTSSMIFVPTGYQSRELIVEAGLNLGTIDSLLPVPIKTGQEGREGTAGNETHNLGAGKQDLGLKGERAMLDVSFDGADEVDEELNCIKGGGACLLQEKLVATSCRKFICVAGEPPMPDRRRSYRLSPLTCSFFPGVRLPKIPAPSSDLLPRHPH
jgi:ribose 5-phosphate isomerase A